MKEDLMTVLAFITSVRQWATLYRFTTIAVHAQKAESAFENIINELARQGAKTP